MKYIYLIKFAFYMAIVLYDCSIDSKYTIAWALLAIIMLIFHLELSIKDYIDEKLTK